MDLESLLNACALAVSSGGITALGEILGTATVSLIKKLRKTRDDDGKNEAILVLSEISQPEKLALDLANAAKDDPSMEAELTEWRRLAEQRFRSSSSATAVSGNAISGINIYNSDSLTITQTVNQ